jgi:hypothetical protein
MDDLNYTIYKQDCRRCRRRQHQSHDQTSRAEQYTVIQLPATVPVTQTFFTSSLDAMDDLISHVY